MDDVEARRHLADERAAALGRRDALISEFDAVVAGSLDANSDDEHDPEGATVAFERARISALIDEAGSRLDTLASALARLDAGTYAECQVCGAAIASERLAARPDATACVGCATGAVRPG